MAESRGGPQEETEAIWNRLGPWWDDHIGPDGNAFHREVVGPVTERLLGVREGERVLDVACGNGQFSRRLAELGASVMAFDLSEGFIERARAHTTAHGGRITYRVADATDTGQLLALGSEGFDAAVANMALMDMAEIAPLYRGLAQVLRPGGRFVFTVLHPCFGYPLAPKEGRRSRLTPAVNAALGVWERVVPEGPRVRVNRAIEPYLGAGQRRTYLEPVARHGLGIVGQPVPHWYFHRPLDLLLEPAFEAGLVLDGLAEPPLPDDAGRPAVLACRLRRPASPEG